VPALSASAGRTQASTQTLKREDAKNGRSAPKRRRKKQRGAAKSALALEEKLISPTPKRKLHTVPYARGFRVPSKGDIRMALGEFGCSENAAKRKRNHSKREFDPASSHKPDWEDPRHYVETKGVQMPQQDHFGSIPVCESVDDWLAQYDEEGQTYSEYLRLITSRSGRFKVSANPHRNTICLLPIGSFDGRHTPLPPNFLNHLRKYTEAFFWGAKVHLLPSVTLESENNGRHLFWITPKSRDESETRQGRVRTRTRFKLTIRYNENYGRRQIQVDSILRLLSAMRGSRSFQKQHPDCFCLVGITMEDLFDTNPDLFVAGMAAGASKVAVFQFYRYDPQIQFSGEFWYKTSTKKTEKETKDVHPGDTLLARCCKLIVHEICHLYSIDHCKFYKCVMNGSGHLKEDFRQPFCLCPVDLRKLARRLGFSVKDRYEKLLEVCAENPALKEFEFWLKSRMEALYGKDEN